MYKKTFFLSLLLFVAGCETTKDPLVGERHNFITTSVATKTNVKKANKPRNMGQPVHNKNWPQIGKNPGNLIGNLAVNMPLNVVWASNIGWTGGNSDHPNMGNVIVNDGVVYGMDSHGSVFARNVNDGSVVFDKPTSPAKLKNDVLGGGVAVDGGKLYITTSFGDVMACDAKTGKTLWSSKTPVPIRIAPTVHNGHVYVLTLSNEFYVFDAKTGAEIWTHSGITETASLLGAAQPAVVGDTVIVAYSSGEYYALNTKDGRPVWMDTLTSAVRIDTGSSLPHIKAAPVIDGEFVYIVSHGGKMAATNHKTGVRVWQKDIGSVHEPAVSKDTLFVITTMNECVALDKKTGETLWIKSLKTSKTEITNWSGPFIINGEIVAINTRGDMVFMSPNDGKVLKTYTLKEKPQTSPIIADKHMFVVSRHGKLHKYG